MTVVFCILATMWAAGCILVASAIAWSLYDNGDWGMFAVTCLLGLPVAFMLAGVPWYFIWDSQSPVLVELHKGEWACTASRTQNSVMPITTGKVTTMVPTVTSVCIQYSRTH